jgi:hypothetical protein
MFAARQIPLLAVFLLVALSGPELATAEPPAPGAGVAAPAEGVASEASSVAGATTPVEAAPPAAETIPPPPTPTESAEPPSLPAGSTETAAPSPSPPPSGASQEAVEHVVAVVDSVARSPLPPEPRQQRLAGVTREVQGALGDAGDQAVKKGGTKAVLAAAKETLPPIGSIEPTLTLSPPSIPASPLPASPETAAPTPALPLLIPAETPFQPSPMLRAPILPVLARAAPLGDKGSSGPSISTDAGSGVDRVGDSTVTPPAADPPSSAGTSPPAVPSLPRPSLPDALGTVTAAPGGAGSGFLLALLAISLLFIPTFASKLRMHAGDCRPAPFVSLLERPG